MAGAWVDATLNFLPKAKIRRFAIASLFCIWFLDEFQQVAGIIPYEGDQILVHGEDILGDVCVARFQAGRKLADIFYGEGNMLRAVGP